MSTARRAQGTAALAALAMSAVACGGSQPVRSTLPATRPAPTSTHDSYALYNDAQSTVHVLGCAGCGASGKAVAPGSWLQLNLPPDSARLEIVQPTRTTCLVLMGGVDSGRPIDLKVSDSAESAC